MLERFVLNSRELAECIFVPLLVSYCCNVLEPKDMLLFRHGVSGKRLSVRYMVIGEYFIGGELAGERSVGATKMARGLVLEIPRNNTESAKDVN